MGNIFEVEKLSADSVNKDSRFAYVAFLNNIATVDTNAKGELVQLNSPCYAGQVALISTSGLKRMKDDFPDRVKGNVIKYGNLENVVNLVFEKIKGDYEKMGVNDPDCDRNLSLLNAFFRDGKLVADHQEESSLEDLANKVFIFQEAVFGLQERVNTNKMNM